MSQVVCIVDEWVDFFGRPLMDGPVRNRVYTIKGHTDVYGVKMYYLAEIRFKWQADAFKPLKKTDISIFTTMLKTKKLEDA